MPTQARLYENLEILNVEDPSDKQILEKLLVPNYGAKLAPQNILYHVLKRLPNGEPICKTVIVEKEYIDTEFANCYSRFYSRLYMNVPRRCLRLHFFKETITANDIYNVENKTYLGYSIIRPISITPIGRTVLSPNINSNMDEFILTQSQFKANLSGSNLKAVGVPFIQQDGRVAACASASLWMAISYLAPKFNLLPKSTIEITEAATDYDFTRYRSTPGKGLTVPQMMNALYATGFSPQLYDHPWAEQAKQIIYSCVESKIPAILAITFKEGHHAEVAIGHTFSLPTSPRLTTENIQGGGQFSYYDNTAWIPEFFIHDDQSGMYGKLRVLNLLDFVTDPASPDTIDTNKLPLPTGTDLRTSDIHCPIEIEFPYLVNGTTQIKKELGNLFAIILPLPPGVSLLPEEATRKVRQLVLITSRLLGVPITSELILRTYLESSNEYKASLINRLDMADWLKSFYRGRPMSKYIWISELSNKQLFNQVNRQDRKMFGEVIIDSAANPYTPSFIAAHIPGYIFIMKPEENDYVNAMSSVIAITDDIAFTCFSLTNIIIIIQASRNYSL